MRHIIFFLLLCPFHIVLGKSESAEVTRDTAVSKSSPDYTPQILGTFLQSVVPSFINMAMAKENDNDEQAMQHLGQMLQGAGVMLQYILRVYKNNPSLTPELCLLSYLRSPDGCLFLQKHRSVL